MFVWMLLNVDMVDIVDMASIHSLWNQLLPIWFFRYDSSDIVLPMIIQVIGVNGVKGDEWKRIPIREG